MDTLNGYNFEVFEFFGVPDIGFGTQQIYAEIDKKMSKLYVICAEDGYSDDEIGDRVYGELKRRFNKYVMSDEFEQMVYSHFHPVEYLSNYTGTPYSELITIPHIKETDPYCLADFIEYYDRVLDKDEFKMWLEHYFDDPPIHIGQLT